jgi:hypothetical protein
VSYPNQNPYGPPPGQQPQQPQYGYPQQQPPQPQPQYGYPQQQPGYPGQFPGGGGMPKQYPQVMPGGVKAGRVMLFALAGLNMIGLILAVVGLSSVSKASKSAAAYSDDLAAMNVGKGLLIALIVLIVIFSAAAVTLALQFANGGPGVRIATIIFGVLNTMASLMTFPFGLVHTTLSILVIVFASKDDGNAWFNRPRY